MKIGFIGMGNMAFAIASGILKKDIVKPEDMIASGRDAAFIKQVKADLGMISTIDNCEVVQKSDIIFLSIKPHVFPEVISEIKEVIRPEQIVISLAPGKTLEWLENQFAKPVKLVRCMPNTPALVGEGCTGVCYHPLVEIEEQKNVEFILSSFGRASAVAESLMDAVVAVSGSSPAYVFILIEAMADGAVAAGMPRKQAYEFAAQAVMGSAKMVLETGKHPAELKDMVCSPGGTTIEAVRVLEEKGYRSAIIDAMKACVNKSKTI